MMTKRVLRTNHESFKREYTENEFQIMKTPMIKIPIIILFLILSVYVQAGELPDNSVYHVDSVWLNQDEDTLTLPDLGGHIQLVAFIYSYCEHTCPTIIATIKQVEKLISAEAQKKLRITLISLDPDRDTPARLKAYMEKQSLDEDHWTMLSGDADEVLTLSAVFGVRYKPMGESDIAHSNMLTILDARGVIRYQMQGLGENLKSISDEIEALALNSN